MDGAIGFSRSPKEATAVNADADTGVADTVCKYCGEDFKFYRSLKHHLRSQSSCYHKPYSCRDCAVGFSTKANCLRHIQKQHRAVTGVSSESRMVVDETLLAAQQKATVTCIGMRKRPLEAADDQRNKVQRLDMMAVMNGSLKMKQEQMEMSSDDQPLDFSLKTMMSNSHPGTPYSGFSLPDADTDEPMDLSVGATRSAAVSETSEFDSCSPISLVVTSRRASPSAGPSASSAGMIQSQPSVTSPSLLQCTQCRAVFKHSAKVQRRSYVHYFIYLYKISFIFISCIVFHLVVCRVRLPKCLLYNST